MYNVLYRGKVDFHTYYLFASIDGCFVGNREKEEWNRVFLKNVLNHRRVHSPRLAAGSFNELIADLHSEKIEGNLRESFKDIMAKYEIDNIAGKYINIGAILVIEKIYKALKNDGMAVIIEYTDENNGSNISDLMPDHKEVSINFNVLQDVAKKIGFVAEIVPLKNFLNIKDCYVMAGESFYAFRSVYNIPKLFYSKEETDRLNIDGYMNIYYEFLDDIISYFKVLILKKF